MNGTLKITLLASLLTLAAAPASADEHSGHDMGDHAAMSDSAEHGDHTMHDHAAMAAPAADEAEGHGTLHAVDAEARTVNLSHAPIPALNWPAMTMDLPVTKRVDLSVFKAGDEVMFTLKKGRDDRFRITAMEAAGGAHHMGHQ
ncbi:copper-binding protein [Endothiovibrio diazotrophicus]